MRLIPLLVLVGLSVALPLGGCEATPRSGPLDRAVADYNSQRYTRSLALSTEVMRKGHGSTRSEASYLAGLSAYRLGRLDEAERHLGVAAETDDRQLQARGKAALALVRLDQNRVGDAADLFSEAAVGLTGEEARQAARHAAHCYAELRDLNQARRWSAQASTRGPDDLGRDEKGLFTIQAGAFSSRSRADRCAAALRPLARRHGLGEVLIAYRGSDTRRPVYLVQFGRFGSRSAAADVRNRIGHPEYIVVATGGSRF